MHESHNENKKNGTTTISYAIFIHRHGVQTESQYHLSFVSRLENTEVENSTCKIDKNSSCVFGIRELEGALKMLWFNLIVDAGNPELEHPQVAHKLLLRSLE